MWLLCTVLVIAGLGIALLAIGAYAQLSSGLPLWLRSIGTLESAVLETVLRSWGSVTSAGALGMPVFLQGMVLSALASAVLGLAAFVKPGR